MNDRTDRTAPVGGQRGALASIGEVKFGKLVQQPRGPVVTGFEHAITSRTRDMPPDVVDACRPDLLVPADANPIQMIETWTQEQGGLVIAPLLRPRVSHADRLWCIAGRIRPYTERGVGQGGRPASMLTAWPLPAQAWAQSLPALVAAMGTDLKAEPELASVTAAERMSRAPVPVSLRPPAISTVGALPRPAIVMIEALRRAKPSRWTRATFPDEKAFLDCLAIVCSLIPQLRGGVPPRALLSASSGLAIGSEHFLISYIRDGSPSSDEKAQLSPAWETYLARSPTEQVSELVARAAAAARPVSMPDDWGRYVFGHAESQEGEYAPEGLSMALEYYRNPGYIRPQNHIVDSVRRNAGQLQPRPLSETDQSTARVEGTIPAPVRRPPGYPAPGSPPPSDAARLLARRVMPPGVSPRGFASPQQVTPPPAGPPRSPGAVLPPGASPGPIPAVSPQARPSVGPPQRPLSAEPWIASHAAALRDATQTSDGEAQRLAMFPIMENLVQRMLLEGVLDNFEMQQLFEWNHATQRDIIGPIVEWAEQNFPTATEANGLRNVVHRSTALQAWRDRMKATPAQHTQLSAAERNLAGYAGRWRDSFNTQKGPQWCWSTAADAIAMLIERTTKGYPPVLAFGELALLKPVLQASSYLPTLHARLAAAMREPAEERNGMPPGSGTAFLRSLQHYLQSIE